MSRTVTVLCKHIPCCCSGHRRGGKVVTATGRCWLLVWLTVQVDST